VTGAIVGRPEVGEPVVGDFDGEEIVGSLVTGAIDGTLWVGEVVSGDREGVEAVGLLLGKVDVGGDDGIEEGCVVGSEVVGVIEGPECGLWDGISVGSFEGFDKDGV